MFSTYEGAKRLAKKLRKAVFEHGVDLSLNSCQRAIAAAGGYRDWQHLRDTLERGGARVAEPEAIKKRLRAALHMLSDRDAESVIAELRPATAETNAGDGVSPSDVWLLHAKRPLFRQGSGPGLHMREKLLHAALQQFENAMYDDVTHSVTYNTVANLREFFGELVDDPRFRTELAKVVQAGVLALDEASDGVRLELLPPATEEIEEHLRGMDEYRRQVERPDAILRPTELTRAQRTMLQHAQKQPLGPADRDWTYNDLVTLSALLASGTVALEPTDGDHWHAAITAAGERALRRRTKPAQDAVEATLLRCHLGRLIMVGPGAADPDAPWHQEIADVPADGAAVCAFARRHGLAVFGGNVP